MLHELEYWFQIRLKNNSLFRKLYFKLQKRCINNKFRFRYLLKYIPLCQYKTTSMDLVVEV